MRIVAGKLGGRVFDSPGGHRTHPMADRVRGALFNALGDIEGLAVLDAFSGSGALGYEAISRGARSVVAIESDPTAYRTMKHNAKTLGLDEAYKPIHAYVKGWLNRQRPDTFFDVIMCDPPYDSLQEATIEKLRRVLSRDGVVVVSWPGKLEPPRLAGLQVVQCKSYGDAQLCYFRLAA